MCAGVLVATEAGAKVTTMEGDDFSVFDRSILAATPSLHAVTSYISTYRPNHGHQSVSTARHAFQSGMWLLIDLGIACAAYLYSHLVYATLQLSIAQSRECWTGYTVCRRGTAEINRLTSFDIRYLCTGNARKDTTSNCQAAQWRHRLFPLVCPRGVQSSSSRMIVSDMWQPEPVSFAARLFRHSTPFVRLVMN